MSDVRIIGGGPAGSAAAIRLARGGWRVELFEKSNFPRAKLCGGFISGEALPELANLGISEALKNAGAWPVNRLVISAASGAEADVPLAETAWSVSRQTLDQLLLEEAKASGVSVHHADGFNTRPDSEWRVVAAGRQGFQSRRFFHGIQAYFADVEGLTDQVELNLFAGGYVGLSRHENGEANICALLEPALMRRLGPDLDRLLSTLVNTHAGLRKRLGRARRLHPWMAVGPVAMGLRSLTNNRTFYVGDAACVVDPFAGEGITHALLSARLMTQALLQNPETASTVYEKDWHQAFDRPLRLQSLLRNVTSSRILQEGLVQGTQVFPALLEWLTEKTRAPLTV